MFKKNNFNGRSNNRDNRGGGNRNFGGGRPEMFRTTCATCGDSCEVPFRPANGKPIYCRSCFQNEMDAQPKFAGQSFSQSSFKKYRDDEKRLYDTECSMCGIDCEVPFKPAPGRPVYCNTCMRNEDRMPMTGPKPTNAFSKSAPTAEANNGPTKAEFAALTAKVDRILALLEGVMADAESDAEMEDEDMGDEDMEDDMEWAEDEEFAEEEIAEEKPEPAKKAKVTKKAAPEKAAVKKPTRGQVKRAKRTGKSA